jgi:hypothetical protein
VLHDVFDAIDLPLDLNYSGVHSHKQEDGDDEGNHPNCADANNAPLDDFD